MRDQITSGSCCSSPLPTAVLTPQSQAQTLHTPVEATMHAQATMHSSARLSPHSRQPAFLSSAPQCAPRCSSSRPHAARQAVGGRQTDCAPASSAQLDRRSLLLGVVIGSQLLSLPRLQSALADELPEITTVFVAGSTGKTGRRVVQQLRAAGYKVRAGVRDVRKAQSLGFGFDSGITIVEGDVTKGASYLQNAIGDAQAVICATGASNLLGFGSGSPASVDEKGTINLIEAAKAKGVKAFVLQTSLLTNAPAMGQKDNPNYKFLNVFGGVLDRKLAAEQYLRGSGLRYTIVRPGGLSEEAPGDVGRLITAPEDTLFGRDTDPGRAISRDTVAEVLVAALRQPAAANKVVEIVSSPSAAEVPEGKWFEV